MINKSEEWLNGDNLVPLYPIYYGWKTINPINNNGDNHRVEW
jgi:hypothetical protein